MGLIYLDTCLAIYLVERRARWCERVAGAMCAATGARFSLSPLVKMGCLVGAMRRADLALQRKYEEWFASFHLLAMPEPVYLRAAELRARFGLRTPDALHLACAQHHHCDSLWTNDNRLARASHGLALRIAG